MTRVFVTICLLFFGFSGEAHAVSCAEILKPFSFEAKIDKLYSNDFGDQIVKDLRPKIQEIEVQDPNFGPESMEAIFNLYLEQRLAPLSEEIRQKVWDVATSGIKMRAYEISSTEEPPFEAFSHRQLYMVFLTLPNVVLQTALDYFIRIHELEHIIQYYAVGKKPLAELHPMKHINLFYFERGAMRSEAAFLRLLPKTYLDKLLELWKSHPHKEGLADDIYNSVVAHAIESQSVEDYVSKQWEHGRYSEAGFRERHHLQHIKFWTSTVLMSSPIWLKLFGVY